MLKASRWAGNVGELAKQHSPISSPLFPAFTPLPYYRVYRSAFTPLGPPTLCTLQAHGHELVGRKKTNIRRGRSHPISVESWAQQIQTSCVYLLPMEWQSTGDMAACFGTEVGWSNEMDCVKWLVLSGTEPSTHSLCTTSHPLNLPVQHLTLPYIKVSVLLG